MKFLKLNCIKCNSFTHTHIHKFYARRNNNTLSINQAEKKCYIYIYSSTSGTFKKWL